MEDKIFWPCPRLLAIGITENVQKDIVDFLWMKIDEVVAKNQADYLQIFEFFIKGNKLLIEHRQEIPKFRKKYVIDNVKEIYKYRNLKIYTIDYNYYSVMMLAEEH